MSCFPTQISLGLSVFVVLLGLGSVVAQTPNSRVPLPDAQRISGIASTLREIHGSPDRQTPKACWGKAAKLLDVVDSAGDRRPGEDEAFALLALAQEFAVRAGEPSQSGRIVDRLVAGWQVDGLRCRIEWGGAAMVTARGNEVDAGAVLLLGAFDEALASRDVELAADALSPLGGTSRRMSSKIRLAWQSRCRDLAYLQATLAAMESARARIVALGIGEMPEPSDSHALGWGQIMLHERWDEGLRHLRHGDQSVFAEAAAAELDSTESASVAPGVGWRIAQCWLAVAKHVGTESQSARRRSVGRARYWLEREDLASGRAGLLELARQLEDLDRESPVATGSRSTGAGGRAAPPSAADQLLAAFPVGAAVAGLHIQAPDLSTPFRGVVRSNQRGRLAVEVQVFDHPRLWVFELGADAALQMVANEQASQAGVEVRIPVPCSMDWNGQRVAGEFRWRWKQGRVWQIASGRIQFQVVAEGQR